MAWSNGQGHGLQRTAIEPGCKLRGNQLRSNLARAMAAMQPTTMSKQASEDSLPDAIGAGKPKRVARLLAQGMSANSADAAGRPVLLLAARAGNRNAVRQLIAAGADVDGRTSDGITAVVVATRCSQYAVVKALVDKGAHVDIVDFQGKTVLDHAMETRRSSARHSFGITQWRIKRLLLQHGAIAGYPYAEPEKLAQLVTNVGQGDAFLDWRATPAGWSGWQLLASVVIHSVWNLTEHWHE